MRAWLPIGVGIVVLWTGSAAAQGVCLGPSTLGDIGTVDCSAVNPQIWDTHVVGYSQTGTPCEFGPSCGFEPRGGVNTYTWKLSASTVSPHVNTGQLPSPIANLYLWYACNSNDGMTAAAFGVVVDDPSLTLLGTQPQNGFLNAATQLGDLLLVVGGCPNGPVLAASLVFLNTTPVSVDAESWGGIKSLYR